MKSYRFFAVFALTASFGSVQAEDIEAGKILVDTNCQHCHGSEVYSRSDRKVQSLPQLKTQVRRCELSLGLKWFDDEIDNTAAYLNHDFYKFK